MLIACLRDSIKRSQIADSAQLRDQIPGKLSRTRRPSSAFAVRHDLWRFSKTRRKNPASARPQSSTRVFAVLATADAARCCTCATAFSLKSRAILNRRSTTAGCVQSERSPSTSSIIRIACNIRGVASVRVLRASGGASPGTKRSTRLPNAYSRSARNSGPKPLRSAPAPAAITSAGYRGLVMRSARRTGASQALLNAFIRGSTPAFSPLAIFPSPISPAERRPPVCCSGATIRSIPAPTVKPASTYVRRSIQTLKLSSSIRARRSSRVGPRCGCSCVREQMMHGARLSQRHYRRATLRRAVRRALDPRLRCAA